MNLSSIQPEQVWQMVIEQLRMQMPQASFNTWVRDAAFVSFENDLLTIGSANAYASEWLSSRLTRIVEQLLTGILGRPISVQFVVHYREYLDEEKTSGEHSRGEEPADKDLPQKVLSLQAEYQSIYDEIIQPERVIVFPGYFLRYIPMLGVELAWLYIGFRQAAYEAGASKNPGKKVSAAAKKVASYAGMSIRSFWRWSAKPSTWKRLRWLVKLDQKAPKWTRGSDGRPHQATRSYRVAMTIPLTPFDELYLRAWLYRKLAAGYSPSATLQSALDTPVEELLPWPEKMPCLEEFNGEPHSVRDVVFEVCPMVAESERAQFNDLTEKLAQHLLPSKDLVFLTHYFVQRWLPHLGAGPGWFVTLMRDRCYLNQRTGEMRDEVFLEQGYAEAARWLGLKRVKTVWEWLRNPEVALFLRETGRENGRWEEAPRRIKVCLGEPMTEADQDQANAILAKDPHGAGVTHRENEGMGSVGASVTHSEVNGNGANGASGMHSSGSTNPPPGANDSHNGAVDSHMRGVSVTPVGGDGTHTRGASGTLDWRDWHSFNALTPDSKHLNKTQTPSPTRDDSNSQNPSCGSDPVVVAGEWKIEELFSWNQIGAKKQKQLIEKGVTARRFISWLLYAASSSGNGIRDPVGHAISRLDQDPIRGAGRVYDRLAGLARSELIDLVQRAFNGQGPSNTDWRTGMDGAQRARLRALADQLGIPAPGSEYS